MHMQKKSVLFLSCEHASNAVPEFLKAHFKSKEAKAILKTHRGYDIGAGDVFWELAKIVRTSYAIQGAYTRLAIDLNRNTNKNHRYSEFTETTSESEKERLEGYWDGFRDAFHGAVKAELSKKNPSQIVHLSIHSFTPELDGKVRNADIGILYDPSRKKEAEYAKAFKKNLETYCPELRVRFNYPYAGKTDGHATALRKIYSEADYLGFEIEFNQGMLVHSNPEDVAQLIAESLPE